MISPVGIPSYEAIGTELAVAATPSWWNGAYIYRRRVTVTALEEMLPAGHPVVIPLDVDALSDSGKLRSDFEDLEVIEAVVGWRWIGREIRASEAEVCFLLGSSIAPGASAVYYLHYGNPAPTIVRPTFVANEWPVKVAQSDPAIAYMKPENFWRNGVTRVPGAAATFAFAGSSIRTMAIRGPDQAIVETQIDDQPWVKADLFFSQREVAEVFRAENLSPIPHRIRLRATHHSNPGSHGRKVELVRFEYVVATETSLDPEEVFADLWGGGGLGGM